MKIQQTKNERAEVGIEQRVQYCLNFDGNIQSTQLNNKLYVAFSNPNYVQPRSVSTKNKASITDVLVAHAKNLSW
jgi:hypothetical protein